MYVVCVQHVNYGSPVPEAPSVGNRVGVLTDATARFLELLKAAGIDPSDYETAYQPFAMVYRASDWDGISYGDIPVAFVNIRPDGWAELREG